MIGLWTEAGYTPAGDYQRDPATVPEQPREDRRRNAGGLHGDGANGRSIAPVVDSVAGSLNNMAQSLAAIKGTDNALAWLETAKGQVGEMVGK